MFNKKMKPKFLSALCIIGLSLSSVLPTTTYADELYNNYSIEDNEDSNNSDVTTSTEDEYESTPNMSDDSNNDSTENNEQIDEQLIETDELIVPEETDITDEISLEDADDIFPDDETEEYLETVKETDSECELINKEYEEIELQGVFDSEESILEGFDGYDELNDSRNFLGIESNFVYNPDSFEDYSPVTEDGAITSDKYSVTDFGADGSDTSSDRAAFQNALNEARNHGGRTVTITVPAGTYYMDSTIYIFSNTILSLDSNAIIKKTSGNSSIFLTNGADDREYGWASSNLGGYTRSKNITVQGGKWDCKVTTETSSNGLYFGHATNVTIKNTTIVNCTDVHLIELTGCKDSLVENVTLSGYTRGTESVDSAKWKEALQLDYTTESSSSFFGPYDNTTCQNIKIKNCKISKYPCAVGTHTRMGNYYHDSISISNCSFSNIDFRAIDLNNYKNFLLSGNTITNIAKPIYIEKSTGTIKKCKIDGADGTAIEIYENSAIILTGNTISNASSCAIKAVENSAINATQNIISNCGTYGILASYGSNTIISGNNISKYKGYGIRIYGDNANRCKSFSITDNTITSGGLYGIHMTCADNSTIGRNSITNASTAAIYVDSSCSKSFLYGNSGNIVNKDKTCVSSGWVKCANGKWNYYDNNVLCTGFYKIGGKWYYFSSNGEMKTGWVKVNYKWYYFKSNGVMQTGWILLSDKWYYLNSNGVMQTGWIQLNSKWYYLNAGGDMQTGWIKLNNKWYYLNENGVMQTGWIKLNSKWYYLNANGVMQKGWIKYNSQWYYLNSNGVMQKGWITLSGKKYYLNSNGVMQRGWITLKNKEYYLYNDGHMACNEWIGNKYVNADGVFVKSR